MPAGAMTAHAQIVLIAFALVAIAAIFELVRRRRLSERYALLWIVGWALVVVFAAVPRALVWVAAGLGIEDPRWALFVIFGVATLALLIYMSIALSRMHAHTIRLAQELALLRLERERDATPRAPSEPPRS